MRALVVLSLVLMLLLLGCSSEDSEVSGNVVKEPVQNETAEPEPMEAEEPEPAAEEVPEVVRFCHDSDNAITKWTQGTVRGYYQNATPYSFEDYCQSRKWIIEFYCDDDEIPRQEGLGCRDGCEAGACL